MTYVRRTGGKRLDKNRMRMRALLFEIQDNVDSVVNSVWIFAGSTFAVRMKSHQNFVRSPVKIDSAPLI